MKQILTRLFEHESLDRATARQVLIEIAQAQHNPIQIASFVTVFNMRPITIAELQGFRDALLELCVKVDLEGRKTIDIVGTGGDGKNTFNISTTSAVVVAGAGYPVTKHGSYGVSSSVGSSDVLIELGIKFTNDQDQLKRQLDKANICFFHAPLFHPALKEVVPIRKQIRMKTFFNMLGPLVNPAQPTYQLFGTYNNELARLYQYILQQTNRQFAVVYALDGYDEISLTGKFTWRTNQTEQVLEPEDIGRKTIAPETLHGGDTVETAASIFKNILQNQGTPEQMAVVTANAGMAIHSINPEQSIPDCIAAAEESITSGKAWASFQQLIALQ